MGRWLNADPLNESGSIRLRTTPVWHSSSDEQSDNFYSGIDYIDNGTGRYLTTDFIGLDGGMNLFAYAGANPIGNIDPMGLFSVEGFASYYHDMFEGRKTASGEIFQQSLMTGAMHDKSYGMRIPFMVTVESLEDPCNSITARVNDRGPFASGSKGREPRPGYIIDLSKSAYGALSNSFAKGHIKVRVSW